MVNNENDGDDDDNDADDDNDDPSGQISKSFDQNRKQSKMAR